jgi:thiamine-monophosphate kinase
VPTGQALLRSGARAGDEVWVSGTLGDARLALEAFRGKLSLPQAVFEAARLRMERPEPRIALGQALRGIASSAIDISDGLVGDLAHVLRRSGVGASLHAACAPGLLAAKEHARELDAEQVLELVFAGGDDYELAFTAPASQREAVQAAARAAATPLTRIGVIDAAPGLRVIDPQGEVLARDWAGFDHFSS